MFVEGTYLGGNGISGALRLAFIALNSVLVSFNSGMGKGLGMNGSFESHTSTLLQLMTLLFSNCMLYILSL